jgi:hypothetical protein
VPPLRDAGPGPQHVCLQWSIANAETFPVFFGSVQRTVVGFVVDAGDPTKLHYSHNDSDSGIVPQ